MENQEIIDYRTSLIQKKWLTINEAANFLNQSMNNEIDHAYVLEIILNNKLKTYIRIPLTHARFYRIVDTDSKLIDGEIIIYNQKKECKLIPTDEITLISGKKELLIIEGGKSVIEEELERLDPAWNQDDNLNKGQRYCGLPGVFIKENCSEVIFELQQNIDEQKKELEEMGFDIILPPPLPPGNYRPTLGFPTSSRLYIATSDLIDYETKLKKEKEVKKVEEFTEDFTIPATNQEKKQYEDPKKASKRRNKSNSNIIGGMVQLLLGVYKDEFAFTKDDSLINSLVSKVTPRKVIRMETGVTEHTLQLRYAEIKNKVDGLSLKAECIYMQIMKVLYEFLRGNKTKQKIPFSSKLKLASAIVKHSKGFDEKKILDIISKAEKDFEKIKLK